MTVILDPDTPLRLLDACPVYAPTPVVPLDWTGRPIWAKNETCRMGLGAFKALGGVYAVASLIAEQAGVLLDADAMQSGPVRDVASQLTFVCASAGNHGLSVAAGARIFGARCRIHLSATVPKAFEERLKRQGADVVWSGADYEESVALAIEDADKTGSVHLADGSWPGYTEAPRRVMEGYTVMAEEMRATFSADGRWPERVYLQAGVGGLAAAVAHTVRARWDVQPEIVVVEPEAAPCLQRSIAEGRICSVAGPVSNMGRLDCKTPSLLAFQILQECADRFETVSDAEADVAAKRASDAGIATTPSGAAGLALAMRDASPHKQSLVILSETA